MTFPEKTKDILYYDDLPNSIKSLFKNIQYNISDKRIFIQKNIDCKLTISNIEKMYYDDDDIFIIKSDIYTIVFWEDIRKWKIIKSV